MDPPSHRPRRPRRNHLSSFPDQQLRHRRRPPTRKQPTHQINPTHQMHPILKFTRIAAVITITATGLFTWRTFSPGRYQLTITPSSIVRFDTMTGQVDTLWGGYWNRISGFDFVPPRVEDMVPDPPAPPPAPTPIRPIYNALAPAPNHLIPYAPATVNQTRRATANADKHSVSTP